MKSESNGYFVFFGPANVGKSTIIGYLLTHEMDESKYLSEVNKIKEKIGDKFQNDRLLSYFVDEATDEYLKSTDQRAYGTSKYVHIRKYGDFVLIDTPGGVGTKTQRYRGISLANIGIFAIEIKQLLSFVLYKEKKVKFRKINDFFSSWFVWTKMHGTNNSIILLTKYDQNQGIEDFNAAKDILVSIIGSDAKNIPIIPTSIDWNNRRDVNITDNSRISWYKGDCLVDLLRKKSTTTARQSVFSEPLLMFYNKKYQNVQGVGTVIKWKINSGILHNKDKVQISPIFWGDKWITVSTSIKSLYDDEFKKPTEIAYPGNIVDTTFSNNNEFNGRSINEIIDIPKTAIVTNVNEKDIKIGNTIDIRIKFEELSHDEIIYLDDVPEEREISFIWFGNLLRAFVIGNTKTNDEYKLKLRIINNYIALPLTFFPKNLILQFLATTGHKLIMTYKCYLYDIYNNSD